MKKYKAGIVGLGQVEGVLLSVQETKVSLPKNIYKGRRSPTN